MLGVKRTNLVNSLLQPVKRTFNNKSSYISTNNFLFETKNNNSSACSQIKIEKLISIFPRNPNKNMGPIGLTKKKFSTFHSNQNLNSINDKKVLSNENICFLKKLNNFRNNGVEYNVFNTECIFQTIWSNFAYVGFADENKTFNNNLEKSNIDFTRTDDDSYSIFQDELAFVDFEDKEKTDNYTYKTENETSSTLQKFVFSNLNEAKSKIGKQKFSLITRIPQEFNINLSTNRSVKIVNMGDSKLLGDKEIKINFTHFADKENQELGQTEESVNLEMRRARSNNISITAEKGFKVKLTARSYLEAESLKINLPSESTFRVKKIGVAENGKINLNNSDLDIRSVFSPNKNSNADDASESPSSSGIRAQSHSTKSLEFSCENSNLNIGSLQGNNFFHLNNCNLIIDNVDCDNFILKSSNSIGVELFINSLEKLEENDFFYLHFSEDLCDNKKNNKIFGDENINNGKLTLENIESAKNKKIYLNQEDKNDMLIVKINPEVLKLLKNLYKEDNEFNIDSDLQNKLFSILHGESNLLSLLIENNKNLYDTDQINRSFVQFLRDNRTNRDSILEKIKANNLFWHLEVTENEIAEILMLINYFIVNVLLKDIPNAYRIVFVDAKNTESIEIKEMTAWDITKKRIQNKMNIAHKRVNNS